MDELIIVIFYLNLASYVNMPKICVSWAFNHQIHFFLKIVKIVLLVLACSQNYELRMQVNLKTFLLSL
jgi:hypothetical protein